MPGDVGSAIKEVFFFDVTTPRGLQKLNALLLTIIATVYLHLFIVPIDFSKWTTGYLGYLFLLVIYFVPGVVETVFFAADDLQFSPAKRKNYPVFFQQQFPSKHIREKFQLSENDSKLYWFKIFNKWALTTHPNNAWYNKALQRGYRCRLIYYLQRWSWRFFVISFVTFTAITVSQAWGASNITVVAQQVLQVPGLTGKLVYICMLVALFLWLRNGHKADAAAPTGVWAEWKEINDLMKAWIDKQVSSVSELEALARD